MCQFTDILRRSALAGFWVRLACLPASSIGQTWSQSILGSRLSRVFRQIAGWRVFQGNARWWTLALSIVAVLLLVSLTFAGTGVIGALTWAFLLLAVATALSVGGLALTVVDVLVLLFVASALVSMGFSSYLKYSAIGFAKMLTFLAGYAGFRVLGAAWGKRPGFYLALAALLLALGLVQSLVGFDQFFHRVDARATWVDPTVNPELNMTRIFGTLQPANPNLLAGFLIPTLAAGLGLVLWSACRLPQAGARPAMLLTLGKLLTLLAATGAVLAALILTGSRGGFLAIGGIGAVSFALLGHWLWQSPDRLTASSRRWLKMLWALVLSATVVLSVAAVLSSPKLQHRVMSMFAMRADSSISYRLNVYHSTLQMIADNPLVGIGPGNDTFKRVYGYYMVPGFNALGAYSVPLEIAAEQGVIGLLIFLALVLTLGIRALYFLETDRPVFEKMTVVILAAGVAGSLMYGVFDTIWYRPSVNLLFWLFVALLAQLTQVPLLTKHTQVPLLPENTEQAAGDVA